MLEVKAFGLKEGASEAKMTVTVEEESRGLSSVVTPLCLTFIDLKKAFDSVETEAVIEALCKQGVSTHKKSLSGCAKLS
ncbi:unnamed protein product [Nippostrongylus brasiliensis]|uniref:Reverse transcriptase domain-containing protein n=1 Tax=Nippostrongylus brasiliensis TaxID=27835 RepID=A0A0N4Y1T0_NIPBR|nr:unnamed protein product [Nippostrongylus brasiliensis]